MTNPPELSDVHAMLDAREELWLDPRAQRASQSKGRKIPEAPDALRTDFQRDRDRIIHTKAFRRLKHKTQVFVSPEQDHYRTRLTHVLEVSQISRTVARALRLNEDLTEAIGLGHDLGHAPFGHVGEEALDEIYRKFDPETGRFRHYEQSLRIVDELEKGGKGLNLTFEVRDGILYHSKGQSNLLSGSGEAKNTPETLEGQTVRICDRVAYVNHDIDDAIRAGLLKTDDLPRDVLATLGQTHAQRITSMVNAIIEDSSEVVDGVRVCKSKLSMSTEVREATDVLKDWMYRNVYLVSSAERDTVDETTRIRTVIFALFERFMVQPSLMRGRVDGIGAPQNFSSLAQSDLARCVCDYIAGMTDRFATRVFTALAVPTEFAS
jgi:dGTPase